MQGVNYQKTITMCTAETMEQQLECSSHKFPEWSCTPEDCKITAALKCPSWQLAMESDNYCLRCRNMDSYCDHRMEDGECMCDAQ